MHFKYSLAVAPLASFRIVKFRIRTCTVINVSQNRVKEEPTIREIRFASDKCSNLITNKTWMCT